MMCALNSRACKGGKKGEYGGIRGENGGFRQEEEGNADYGGMVQPSQQHVAQCVKVVEWGLGRRGSLRMLA